MTDIKIQMSITRSFGELTVQFGAEQFVEVQTVGERHLAYQKLSDALYQELDLWVSESLPKFGIHKQPQEKQLFGNVLTTTIEATHMERSTFKGKTHWKVFGGRYEKFGVIIYPEHLKSLAFIDLLEGKETYDLSGYTATIELENDKPKRAIKILRSI